MHKIVFSSSKFFTHLHSFSGTILISCPILDVINVVCYATNISKNTCNSFTKLNCILLLWLKRFSFSKSLVLLYILMQKVGLAKIVAQGLICYHSKGVWHEGWRGVHPKGSHEMGIHCLIFTCFLNGRSSLS